MFGNKIRMTFAAFAVTGGLAVATGPMLGTAAAAPVQGGGSGGSSSKCDNLQQLFNQDATDAVNAYNKGDSATYQSKLTDASNDLKYAQKAGCGWAASARLPQPRPIVRVSIASARLG